MINFCQNVIEELRKSLEIEKMYILGHSLGGFMAAHYTLKYPEKIIKTILISPAGFSKNLVEKESKYYK